MAASATLGILPLFLGGLGSLVSGFLSAPLTRLTGDLGKTRRTVAQIGFGGAGLLLLLSTRMATPLAAMIAMGFASFCSDLVMPCSWGTCMDVGGQYAGTLSGAMNMMGNLGGAVSPTVIGYILHWTHDQWNITFYVSAAVYFIGVCIWRFIDPVTPLEMEAQPAV
jgi:MFS family permease